MLEGVEPNPLASADRSLDERSVFAEFLDRELGREFRGVYLYSASSLLFFCHPSVEGALDGVSRGHWDYVDIGYGQEYDHDRERSLALQALGLSNPEKIPPTQQRHIRGIHDPLWDIVLAQNVSTRLVGADIESVDVPLDPQSYDVVLFHYESAPYHVTHPLSKRLHRDGGFIVTSIRSAEELCQDSQYSYVFDAAHLSLVQHVIGH